MPEVVKQKLSLRGNLQNKHRDCKKCGLSRSLAQQITQKFNFFLMQQR